jgi:Mn2+/Fe2+ NRAMP family transporter
VSLISIKIVKLHKIINFIVKNNRMKNANFLKSLGPGLLWAGAAIGVSHLVQSTRAGADFGFYLIGILIFANVIKYPFFEFAPRYANATGKSLIFGYNQIGKWAISLYAFLTFATMFAIQAAVTTVTASILKNVFNINLSITYLSLLLLLFTMVLLIIGKFSILDKLMKLIIILLSLSVIVAVISAFSHGYNPNPQFINTFDWGNATNIAFVIAFIGWMPAPIDVSVWHSYWSVEKQGATNYKPKLKEALLDFKIGYYGTAILAIGFLSLGALLMYGSGEEFSANGSEFSGQVISLFTKSIGNWAYPVIAIAAFTTMFSTTLTCLDAYSKVLKPTTEYLIPKTKNKNGNFIVWFWLIILVIGALLLISVFSSSMKIMVDIATTLSFVTAPILAFLNYKAVTSSDFPNEYKPKKALRIYAIIGIIFLSMFSIGYIIWILY